MKFLRTFTVIVFLSFSIQSRANDSLTLAQAYINLSLTDEYFDTLTITRLGKILPFIEQELSVIKDTAFIRNNSTIYHFTYSLLYTNMARFLYRTRQEISREELLRWKSMLDKAIDHFNLSMAKTYSVESDTNPFYEFVKFNDKACNDLKVRIKGLKYYFAYHFNQDIYPDFKRIFYAAKNSNNYYLDSLSYFAAIYNMQLSLAIMNNHEEMEDGNFNYTIFLSIETNYKLSIGLNIISKFIQFDYLAKEKKVEDIGHFNSQTLFESWGNFIREVKPHDNRRFSNDDGLIAKDIFFTTEINASTCDNLYDLLQKKYPKNNIFKDSDVDGIPDYKDSRSHFFYFPVPVPFPSLFYYVANYQPGLKTMKQVDSYLSGVFNQAGYAGNLHYYYVKDGFAMTTSLEKIDKDGSPANGSARWNVSVAGNEAFSFYDVFKSIFFETKSDFRMFALVISPRAASIQSRPSSIGAMQELIRYSYPSLPDDLKNYTLPYKTLSAFAYIFSQSDIGQVPMLDVSRRLSMQTHLQKSGLSKIISNR